MIRCRYRAMRETPAYKRITRQAGAAVGGRRPRVFVVYRRKSPSGPPKKRGKLTGEANGKARDGAPLFGKTRRNGGGLDRGGKATGVARQIPVAYTALGVDGGLSGYFCVLPAVPMDIDAGLREKAARRLGKKASFPPLPPAPSPDTAGRSGCRCYSTIYR